MAVNRENHLMSREKSTVSTVLVLSQLLRVKSEFIPMSSFKISWDILPKNKMLPEIQRPCDWDILRGGCLSIREIPM